MPDYCVTFLSAPTDANTPPKEVYHTHVNVDFDLHALEAALTQAVQLNVSLMGADMVAIRSVAELTPDIRESIDRVRSILHGSAPATTQAPDTATVGHLH